MAGVRSQGAARATLTARNLIWWWGKFLSPQALNQPFYKALSID